MSNPIIDEIKREFQQGSVLMRLIFINIGVFLVINIVDLVLYLFKIVPTTGACGNNVSFLTYWLSVPADMSGLLRKPWTIFTYMIVHEGTMHILLNMLVFYFSGKIFLQFLNEKKLLSTYILGGLTGALFFILAYNLFPIFRESLECAICLGASASVMAVMIAIASFAPNFSVNLILLGQVKLKYIAIVYIVLDIISIKSSNPGGHIAHLGGALWGYFYILQYKKGKDFSTLFTRIFDLISGRINKIDKNRVSSKKSDLQYNAEKLDRQQRLDTVLDKISKSGYDSLSKEEKDFLFRASNKQ